MNLEPPKKEKPERALLARGLNGTIIVIATDSWGLTIDIECVGSDADADLGIVEAKECPTTGLYLWEGGWHKEMGRSLDGDEPYTAYVGKVRPTTREELPVLLAMQPEKILCHECSKFNEEEVRHIPPQCAPMKEVYCHPCSVVGGADRAIYHLEPACLDEADSSHTVENEPDPILYEETSPDGRLLTLRPKRK